MKKSLISYCTCKTTTAKHATVTLSMFSTTCTFMHYHAIDYVANTLIVALHTSYLFPTPILYEALQTIRIILLQTLLTLIPTCTRGFDKTLLSYPLVERSTWIAGTSLVPQTREEQKYMCVHVCVCVCVCHIT